MHQHHRAHVVDPEIVILTVTQGGHLLHGGFFRLGGAHRAAGFQLLVIGQNAGSRFDHMPRHDLFPFVEIDADLLDHHQTEREQHSDRNHRYQPQAFADREFAQQIHLDYLWAFNSFVGTDGEAGLAFMGGCT